MPTRIPRSLSMLLAQLPTVLTLALLAAVAGLGYHYDWKIPRLPVLLGRADSQAEGEAKKEEDGKEEAEDANKPLPLVKLASEEKAATAGIKVANDYVIQPRSVGEYVTANGEIDFDQDRYAHLASRASGTAWSVYKHAGDEVKKGDALALVACPELARIKFDLQQTLLLVQTRERLLRRRKQTGSATAPQLVDEAEVSLREARIRLIGYQQSLQDLGLTVRHEDLAKLSDEDVAVRLRTLGIPDSLMQQLDTTTLTNNLLPMYAPFDGAVVKRDIVIGEIVNPSTPQFVLADLRRLWIMMNVRLEDAGKLKRDQEVAFHLDGANEDAPPAKIAWISAEVEEKSHTVAVRADVANPHGRLRPHTFGTARILIGRAQRLTVPNESLQFDGQSHLVFVRGESALEFQPTRVQLGTRHEEFTEIVSGIQPGQVLATSGSHVLLSEMLKKRIGGED
jgi:cobalt-zinc-cadmium efflux system membrane fusion protein